MRLLELGSENLPRAVEEAHGLVRLTGRRGVRILRYRRKEMKRLVLVVLAVALAGCALVERLIRDPSRACPTGMMLSNEKGGWQCICRHGFVPNDTADYLAGCHPPLSPTQPLICEPDDPSRPYYCGAVLECLEGATDIGEWCIPAGERICGEDDSGCWHHSPGEDWQFIPAPPPPEDPPSPDDPPVDDPLPPPDDACAAGPPDCMTIDVRCGGAGLPCGIGPPGWAKGGPVPIQLNRYVWTEADPRHWVVILDVSYCRGAPGNKVHAEDACYPGPVLKWTNETLVHNCGAPKCHNDGGTPFPEKHILRLEGGHTGEWKYTAHGQLGLTANAVLEVK